MSVEILGSYEGNLKLSLTHSPSSTELKTAAPIDNNGDGSSFSPTDLLVASLGSCMVTVMAIVAERNNVDLKGLRVRLVKYMATEPVRRVGKIEVFITMPATVPHDQRDKLERAAHTCPVAKSLSSEVGIDATFQYVD
jgi:putative redox protein